MTAVDQLDSLREQLVPRLAGGRRWCGYGPERLLSRPQRNVSAAEPAVLMTFYPSYASHIRKIKFSHHT